MIRGGETTLKNPHDYRGMLTLTLTPTPAPSHGEYKKLGFSKL
jgi:hypothetical protein